MRRKYVRSLPGREQERQDIFSESEPFHIHTGTHTDQTVHASPVAIEQPDTPYCTRNGHLGNKYVNFINLIFGAIE